MTWRNDKPLIKYHASHTSDQHKGSHLIPFSWWSTIRNPETQEWEFYYNRIMVLKTVVTKTQNWKEQFDINVSRGNGKETSINILLHYAAIGLRGLLGALSLRRESTSSMLPRHELLMKQSARFGAGLLQVDCGPWAGSTWGRNQFLKCWRSWLSVSLPKCRSRHPSGVSNHA